MKYKFLIVAGLMLPLSACDQLKMNSNQSLCSDETSISLTKELLADSILKDATNLYKESLSYGDNEKVNLANIRAMSSQVSFDVFDVRTSKNDPESSKDFCESKLTVQIPDKIVTDANESRKMMSMDTLQDWALLNNFDFSINKLNYDLEYFVQPTDDGLKTYGSLLNADLVSTFVAQTIFDASKKTSLRKAELDEQKAKDKERLSRIEAEKAAEKSARDAKKEIKSELAVANNKNAFVKKELNKYWKKQSAEIQEIITPFQKDWLDTRDETCLGEAMNADTYRQELVRVECEARMTKNRIVELKNLVGQYK